jgi:response regulator RpfG family c-di-GMP phosphodiesterase
MTPLVSDVADGVPVADGLERLGAVALDPTVDGALRAARELLGMGLAYVTRHTETHQHFLQVDGDGDSFGVGVGTCLPLEATYCQAILEGRLPAVMPDLRAYPLAASMPVTEAAGVGAYVSVPVLDGEGRLTGTLCCADHGAQPALGPRDVQFLHVLARMICEQLERDRVAARTRQLEMEAAGVRALMAAVHARDRYTAAHSRTVVSLAARVAQELGCGDDDVRTTELVALLHDLGKLRMPDEILHSPCPLTDEQWAVMRTHPAAGAEIVAEIPELAPLAPAIRAEHERWDGGGYPDGLAGDEIPLASQIAFVCDAFHAMTSDRPYRAAMSVAEAMQELRGHAGTQFAPGPAAALLRVLER